jgi:hypothetical protein
MCKIYLRQGSVSGLTRMTPQSDQTHTHPALVIATVLGAILAIILWLAMFGVVQNITAGGPQYLGNLSVILPQPLIEVLIATVLCVYLGVHHPPARTSLKWICATAWTFTILNCLTFFALGLSGAMF